MELNTCTYNKSISHAHLALYKIKETRLLQSEFKKQHPFTYNILFKCYSSPFSMEWNDYPGNQSLMCLMNFTFPCLYRSRQSALSDGRGAPTSSSGGDQRGRAGKHRALRGLSHWKLPHRSRLVRSGSNLLWMWIEDKNHFFLWLWFKKIKCWWNGVPISEQLSQNICYEHT